MLLGGTMRVSQITLEQHADIYEHLKHTGTLETSHTGMEQVFCGTHEELGVVILFQNHSGGVLIEPGKPPH